MSGNVRDCQGKRPNKKRKFYTEQAEEVERDATRFDRWRQVPTGVRDRGKITKDYQRLPNVTCFRFFVGELFASWNFLEWRCYVLLSFVMFCYVNLGKKIRKKIVPPLNRQARVTFCDIL